MSRGGRLARAIGVLALLFTAALGALRWHTWRSDMHLRLDEAQADLALVGHRLAELPHVVQELEGRLERIRSGRASWLVTDGGASGADYLRGLLMEAARAGGLQVVSVDEVAPVTLPASMAVVQVTLTALGDVEGLAALLHSIEAAPYLLAVRALSVVAHDPHGVDEDPEVLTMSLTIEALTRGPDARFGGAEQ